ncbi:MAG: hypothetical protein QF735_06515 [Phycisphaeraceae bacterium]|nr:hypothetical protein [Phycisphaeraceae bacterium]
MDHIQCQDAAIAVLQSALSYDRAHHAYIFHGPAGVGKCTTALAFTKVLLCHEAQRDLAGRISACDTCESCRLWHGIADAADATRSAHPDLHLIRKELAGESGIKVLRDRKQTNIPVDLLREQMIGGTTGDDRYHAPIVGKTPALRHNKVFIIDEAELLDAPGQNALLKTLEEPPAGTYIMLVTASEDQLLPTIRSRCQRVTFGPLSEEVIAHWLDESAKVPAGTQRDWVVHFAGGSLGRAQLAVQYDLFDWAQAVVPALSGMASRQFDAALGSDIASRIDEFAQQWVKAHPNASKDAANRRGAELMWVLITQHARAELARAAGQHATLAAAQLEQRLKPWLAVIDAVHEAQAMLRSHLNMGMVCDHLCLAMNQAMAGRERVNA